MTAEACRYLASGLEPPTFFSRYQKFETDKPLYTQAELEQLVLGFKSVPATKDQHRGTDHIGRMAEPWSRDFSEGLQFGNL